MPCKNTFLHQIHFCNAQQNLSKKRSKKQGFLCSVQQWQRHEGLQFYRVKMYERTSFLWSFILRRKTHSRVSSLLTFWNILQAKCTQNVQQTATPFAVQKCIFASGQNAYRHVTYGQLCRSHHRLKSKMKILI